MISFTASPTPSRVHLGNHDGKSHVSLGNAGPSTAKLEFYDARAPVTLAAGDGVVIENAPTFIKVSAIDRDFYCTVNINRKAV